MNTETKDGRKPKWVISNIGPKTVYTLKDEYDNELGLVSVTKYDHAFNIIGISYIGDKTKEFCNVITQLEDKMVQEINDAKQFLCEEWNVAV